MPQKQGPSRTIFLKQQAEYGNSSNPGTKSRLEAAVSSEQGGEADGARTRDLQRDRLAL